MEGWQRKLDMAKVAVALVETLSASSTFSCLTRNTHVSVHGTVRGEGARVVGGGGEVVYISVGDFEDGLVHNVLVGAAACQYTSHLAVSACTVGLTICRTGCA